MALSGLALGAPWRPQAPPGVYEDRTTRSIARDVRMDVAAFVGLTERGPVSTPVAIDSWGDFQAVFGGAGGGRLLPDSVYLFFANGGRRCVVVRALNYTDAGTARWNVDGLSHRDGTPVEVAARNPGAWGLGLEVEVSYPTHPLSLRPPRADELAVVDSSLHGRIALGTPHPQLLGGSLIRVLVDQAGVLNEAYLFATELRETTSDDQMVVFDDLLDSSFHIPDGGGGEILESAVVSLDIKISLTESSGSRQQELWQGLGLHPQHPSFFVRLLSRRAASEGLMRDEDFDPGRPDAGQFELTQADRQLLGVDIRRTGSELVRFPWSDWNTEFLPTLDLLGGVTSRRSGPDLSIGVSDAAESTGREHFFSAPGDALTSVDLETDRLGPGYFPYAMQPAPLDTLSEYDDHNETAPVSLVHMPDLAHPFQFDQFRDPSTSLPPTGTRFGVCVEIPAVIVSREHTYEKLSLSDASDYEELRSWQQVLVEYCEQRADRIAVLDLPPGLQAGEIINWRRSLASRRGALFAPYLSVRSVESNDANPRIVPPGGAVCGLIARRDTQVGVQASPGNQSLQAVAALHEQPQFPSAGFLHAERVNAVRPTPTGLTLLGSRTTALGGDWTHVSVRRLVDYLERQLALDTRWAVFEPNNPALWHRLIDIVEARLRPLYDRGAFRGATPAQAYFVRCDAEVNTPQVLDQGRVIVLVGVAVARPAEFIVFRLTQHSDGAVTLEESGG